VTFQLLVVLVGESSREHIYDGCRRHEAAKVPLHRDHAQRKASDTKGKHLSPCSKVRTSIPVLHVSLKQDCLSTLAAHRRHWKLCRLLCQTAVSNQSQHDQCCMTNAITNSSNFFVCCRLPVLAMADSVVVLMQDTSVPHANQDPELTAVSKQHT